MLELTTAENCTNELIEKHSKGSQANQCLDCIDYLNWVRLMIMPRQNIGIEANQQVAINYVDKFAHELDLQGMFLLMKKAEAIAAAASVIYNERIVKAKIADPKELERKADDWKRAEKEMRDKNRPTKERKMLSDFEKAVKQLTDVHVSEEAAIEIVKERFAKQGKVTQ
jgi:hypothetical protein